MKNEKLPATVLTKFEKIKEKERNMLAAYGEKEISKQLKQASKTNRQTIVKSRERRINQDLIHLDNHFGENSTFAHNNTQELNEEDDAQLEMAINDVKPNQLITIVDDHKKPPLANNSTKASDPGRALVKRLNAERRAREKKKAEAEKLQQERFKEELENKKRQMEIKQKIKEDEKERKRQEARRRIDERKEQRALSLQFMREETKKIGKTYRSSNQLYSDEERAAVRGRYQAYSQPGEDSSETRPKRLYVQMKENFDQNIIRKEEEERENRLRELKQQKQQVTSYDIQVHQAKYQNILK